MPENHDFIVIGAGPGGANAAKFLAKRGFDTLIIEKDRLPRSKPCGGWVTGKAWEMLGWNDNRVSNHIFKGTVFYDPAFRRSVLSLDMGDRAVFRDEFDHAIAMDAVDAGAALKDGEKARGVSRKGNRIEVRTTSGEYSARAVIGADGTGAFTGRQLGLKGQYRPDVHMLTQSKRIRLTGRLLEEFDLPYPKHSHVFLTNYALGYGWLSRRDEWLNIGVGHPAILVDGRSHRARIWNRFTTDLQRVFKFGEIPEGMFERPRTCAYPVMKGPDEPTFGDRVLLVGDAGGFSANLAGEGIGPALLTGKLAAYTLDLAHGKEDYSGETLSIYEKLWKTRMQASFRSSTAFLQGYMKFERLRRWMNNNALDFLDIYARDPILMDHLKMLLTPDVNKKEAFAKIKRDIPTALFRFMKKKVGTG